MQARNAICQARVDRMPSTCWGKKQNVGGGEEESGLWKDKLGGDANPAKKFARKAAQFMKSLGLIDQLKSVTLD